MPWAEGGASQVCQALGLCRLSQPRRQRRVSGWTRVQGWWQGCSAPDPSQGAAWAWRFGAERGVIRGLGHAPDFVLESDNGGPDMGQGGRGVGHEGDQTSVGGGAASGREEEVVLELLEVVVELGVLFR